MVKVMVMIKVNNCKVDNNLWLRVSLLVHLPQPAKFIG